MLGKILVVLFGLFNYSFARTINLSNNNFVSLIGPVSQSSVDDTIKSLNSKSIIEYMNDNQNINIYINSPGGSVFAGNHLVQYIRTLQASNINVNCIAQNFMSMAFIIMQSCTNRYVMFDSVGMQHQISFGISGNIENFKTYFGLIERVNNFLIDMEINKIGITKEVYLQKVLSDWWLYGEDNIKYNIADELITLKCNPSILSEKNKKTEYFYGLEYEIELNKCPLIHEIKITDKSSKKSIEKNSSKIYEMFDFENYPFNVKTILNNFH